MTYDEIRKILDAREAGAMPDQRSVTEQLRDLHSVAVRLGMYDAADALGFMIQKRRR